MDGLDSGSSSDPECGPIFALFSAGEKCEKPLETLPQQLHEEAMRDQDLGDAGHHEELECQRSAPNSLLYSVLVKTLKTSKETVMKNWNVGDLLHRRGGILSREKTLKTSTSTTPSANWNVNRLLDRLPDDLDKRHDRRRYHQLFHRLRRTKDCASSAGWTHDLGHFDNLLGNREVERCEKVHQLFYHLRHNVVEQRDQRHRVDDLLRGAQLYPLLRQHLKQRCWPPGGWCLPNVLPGVHRKVPGTSRLGEGIFRNTAVQYISRPSPRPLPSSVSVELSGG